jgi:hypothetical protein
MTNALSKYYTEEQVSEILNKTIPSLRVDACKRKGAPRTKIGKRILYRIDAFNAWLEKHETDFDKLNRVK